MTSALMEVFEQNKPNHGDNCLWLEFGVWEGRTIKYISNQTNGIVYGFDSFEGLPEDWRDGFLKEHFNRDGKTPETNKNVVFEIGWFNETLEPFLEKHKNKKITFLHVDCDLYSSSKYVLDKCSPFMVNGTIITFDELMNYDGYEECEWKALNEWSQEYDVKYEWIGTHPHKGLRQSFSLKILSIKN